MKYFLITTAFGLLLSASAFATDPTCPGCGTGGYPPPPTSPYPPEPGYPGSGNSPVYPSPYPSYPNDPYPYPDYPGTGYPYPSPYPPAPQPYPYPMPPAPQPPRQPPAPQPPRVCHLTTSCQTECSWRPNANDYQQICTVFDCRGNVVRYVAQTCVPGEEPKPEPIPGQDDSFQKPGMEVVYTTTAQTFFKAETVDSSRLGANKKCLLGVGTLIEGKILAIRSDRLVKISLLSGIEGCTSFGKTGHIGFVYGPHVRLN